MKWHKTVWCRKIDLSIIIVYGRQRLTETDELRTVWMMWMLNAKSNGQDGMLLFDIGVWPTVFQGHVIIVFAGIGSVSVSLSIRLSWRVFEITWHWCSLEYNNAQSTRYGYYCPG